MNRFLVIFISILLALPFSGRAQATDYIVGAPMGSNSGTSYPSPFANWFWGSRQQYLILASELQALGANKGDISEIAFNVLNINACPPLQGYTMWVKTTSTSTLNFWEPNMGSPVFGPSTYTPSLGWNAFSFPEISWNGNDNIVIEVCWNNSSFLSNGNASVEWTTGLPFNASYTYYADNSSNCGTTSSSFTTPTTRPRVRLRLEPPFANDAQPVALNKPGLAICDNSKDVEVSFQNTGTGTLNNLQFSWTVIRNNNSFPVTNYNWSGNLLSNAIESNLLIGTFAPGFENGDIIKFWTSNPNGVPDSSVENDTIAIKIRDGISGTYNVGGIFNIDFPTINLATQFADSFGAVCDTLIFNIRDGVYYGQLSINDVINSASNRPIIFRAENGENANVLIVDSTLSAGNYIFDINHTNHVIFENIDFWNASSGNNNRVITLTDNSSNVTFYNCTIQSNYSGTNNSSNHALIFSSYETLENGLTVSQSFLKGGNYAIYSGGKNIDTTEAGLYVHASTFEDQVLGAIFVSNVANTQIHHNQIYSNHNPNQHTRAININGNVGYLNISNNKIGGIANWPTQGVLITDNTSIPANKGLVSNNFIISGNTSGLNNQFSLHAQNSSFINFYNNTFALYGSSSNSNSVLIEGGGANNMVNNNIVNFTGGIAMSYQEVSGFPVYESDYNNFFSTGQFALKHKTSLFNSISQWSGNIGDDNHSHMINPTFFSTTDLHLCSQALDNLGKPLMEVSVDIDNEPRNTKTPDIGADEYSPINGLNLGNDTTVCKGTEIELRGTLNFDDINTTWNTGDTTKTIWIDNPGIYSVTTSNICGTASDTIVVSLSPSANLGADTNICADVSLFLDANVSNSQYNWSTGETSKTKQISQPGIYSVTVTDAKNCITIDTIFVTQSQKANLPNDTALCGGKSIFLNPQTGPGTYSWSTGSTAPSILALSTGTYTVAYTDLFGCASTDSTRVIISNIPNAQFTDSIIVYTVIFNSDFYPNANYLWDFGDGTTSNQQNPIKLYPGAGNYVVTLQISNDCGANFFSKEVGVALGSEEEIKEANEFSIFPNPSNGIFNIYHKYNVPVNLKIYNAQGKIVLTKTIINQFEEISSENLAPGIYNLEFAVDNFISNKKIIIH